MLDSTQGASANTIGDFFELPDLDPEVDEIVCKDGLRYHRHPRGRFDSDILLDFYTFGLPANEGIARAQALSAGAPQWLEPIGADNEDDLQRYAAQGYRSLGQWFVMGHRMTGSSPAPGVHCGGAGCRCGERSDAGFRSMAAWRLSGKRWSLRTTRMCARWCPFPTIDGGGSLAQSFKSCSVTHMTAARVRRFWSPRRWRRRSIDRAGSRTWFPFACSNGGRPNAHEAGTNPPYPCADTRSLHCCYPHAYTTGERGNGPRAATDDRHH